MGRVPTMDEWKARLSARDGVAREEAQEALGDLLCSGDESSREETARALLQELGRPGTKVAGSVLFLLQRSWWPPQASLVADALQAVMAVLPGLEADAPEVEHAALVLTNVCRVEPSRLSFLEGAFTHPRASVRSAAARVVGRVGPAALPWMARLLALLDDEESVAIAALESLGSLAPLAPELTAPRLLEQVRKTDGARLYLVLVSLRSLVEERRLSGQAPLALADLEPALLSTLEEPEPPIRMEAVCLLGLTGPRSPDALAALREQLKDESPSVAACAAVALLRLGAPPAEALFLLKGQLGPAAAPDVQGAALSALEEVDAPTLIRAKGMLESVVRDTTGPTREALRELLAQLD
ncbi:HEAT repeat domain-containing protein [Corallococcus sp. BB11-1]|uniref:HEAT repeat domain-containing protein n=1 Tax=Corallococcus sp. BB11-1 TaxID=2996783 RepID=UPI00226F859B|nr:HEAT repeat domain-containing protein [Corallococcus sp. BB11-1]MCY1031024.1 HEAT repeat domain-containing protein [Corallococcus sp. BB11-1]